MLSCASCKLSTQTQRKKGGVVGQIHPPLPFSKITQLRGRRFLRDKAAMALPHSGLVAQGIERPPPKRQVDGSNPSGVTTFLDKRP